MIRGGGVRAVRTAGVLAGGVLLAAALGCRTRDGDLTSTGEGPQGHSEGMRGVSLSSYNIGDTQWILHADSASVFRERKRVEADQIRVDFYENDEHVSVLTSETGILNQATDDLETRGNVKVRTDEGELLETEVLYWDHQRSLIHTDAFVKLTSGENVLTGIGLETDPGLNDFQLKNEIRGTAREVPGGLADEDRPSGERGE
jgi:LPS export ABC transporter protein LptC